MKRLSRDYLFRAVVLGVLLLIVGMFATRPIYEFAQRGSQKHQIDQNLSNNVDRDGFLGIKSDSWTAIFTGVLAFFTIILAVTASTQIVFLIRADQTSRKGAQAAQDAANVAKDTLISTHRSWIRVYLHPKQNFYVSVIGDRIFANIRIIIKNIGDSPAQPVHIYTWLFIDTGEVHFVEWHKRKCDEIRTMNVRPGMMLFPGEDNPREDDPAVRTWSSNASIVYVERGLVYGRQHNQAGIVLRLLGCVSYGFASDKKQHQTRFAYAIEGKNGGWISLDELHPLSGLRVSEYPFGEGMSAD